MKTKIAILLVLLLILTVFAGCGSDKVQDKPGVSSPEEPSDDSTDKTDDNGQEGEVPGTELSTFINQYTETKQELWDALTVKFDEEQNLEFAMGSLAFVFTDLVIVEIVMFDTLIDKDGDTYKGTLMFSGIEAWKKDKGDIIEFGYDFVATEDNGTTLKGDRQVSLGKLDKNAGSVVYDKYTERDGKKVSRIVIEITRNSDNSYSSQVLMVDENSTALTNYATWFEGEDIIAIIGTLENSSMDFSYSSIFNKRNVTAEQMTAGMTEAATVSFVGGDAVFKGEE